MADVPRETPFPAGTRVRLLRPLDEYRPGDIVSVTGEVDTIGVPSSEWTNVDPAVAGLIGQEIDDGGRFRPYFTGTFYPICYMRPVDDDGNDLECDDAIPVLTEIEHGR